MRRRGVLPLEMLLKDNYELNNELYIAWDGLKQQSETPTADYAALIEGYAIACEPKRRK